MKTLAETLRLDYAQFLELEVFTRFGAMVDERSRRTIEHGRRIRAMLAQPEFRPLGLVAQIAMLLAPARESSMHSPSRRSPSSRGVSGEQLQEACPDVAARIAASGDLGDEDRTTLLAALDRVSPKPGQRRHNHHSPRPSMEKLARLRAQIASLDELRDLIRAMRALAASHVQEAQTCSRGFAATSRSSRTPSPKPRPWPPPTVPTSSRRSPPGPGC